MDKKYADEVSVLETNVNVEHCIEQAGLDSLTESLTVIFNGLNSKINIKEIEAVVHNDPVVAQCIVPLINNSLPSLSSPVETLDNVFNTVDPVVIRNITLFALLYMFTKELRLSNITHSDFWLHSVTTANIAGKFAEQFGLDYEDAYISGLLHDIGKLILYSGNAEQNEVFKIPHTESDISSYEKETWKYEASEISSVLLRKWNIPEEIIDAVSTYRQATALSQVNGAILLANEFSNVCTDEFYRSELERPRLIKFLDSINISEDEFGKCCVALPDIAENSRQMTMVLSGREYSSSDTRPVEVSLVTSSEYSLTETLLRFIGFNVDKVQPGDIPEYESSDEKRSSETSDSSSGQPESSTEQKIIEGGVTCLFSKLVPIGGQKNNRNDKDEHDGTISGFFYRLLNPLGGPISENKSDKRQSKQWKSVIVIDLVESISIEDSTAEKYYTSKEENPEKENILPFIFSKVDFKGVRRTNDEN